MFPHHPTHPSSQPGGHTSLHAALLILGVFIYILCLYLCGDIEHNAHSGVRQVYLSTKEYESQQKHHHLFWPDMDLTVRD